MGDLATFRRELAANLKRARVADGLQPIGDRVADRARASAPVLSGRLRRSITATLKTSNSRRYEGQVFASLTVGPRVPYAWFQNPGYLTDAATEADLRAMEDVIADNLVAIVTGGPGGR